MSDAAAERYFSRHPASPDYEPPEKEDEERERKAEIRLRKWEAERETPHQEKTDGRVS